MVTSPWCADSTAGEVGTGGSSATGADPSDGGSALDLPERSPLVRQADVQLILVDAREVEPLLFIDLGLDRPTVRRGEVVVPAEA